MVELSQLDGEKESYGRITDWMNCCIEGLLLCSDQIEREVGESKEEILWWRWNCWKEETLLVLYCMYYIFDNQLGGGIISIGLDPFPYSAS